MGTVVVVVVVIVVIAFFVLGSGDPQKVLAEQEVRLAAAREAQSRREHGEKQALLEEWARERNPLAAFHAARRDDLLLLNLALTSGLSVDAAEDDGTTLLHAAAQSGAVGAVAHLLDLGASTTATDEDGDTAAAHANYGGHPQIAAVLEKWASSDESARRELLSTMV